MTQIALGVAISQMKQEIKEKCPFKLEVEAVNDDIEESIIDDDRDSNAVYKEQKNNGGTLGDNLISGGQGTKGSTLNPPSKAEPEHRQDKHGGFAVRVKASNNIKEDTFPIVNAAHHIIPGNASLKASKLKDYMTKGKTVTVKLVNGEEKKWKVKEHIGYNINGAHNGVWLAASYAIRKGKTPVKETWSTVANTNPDWCVNYIAAATKACGSQFHDTHEPYSENVTEYLDKLAFALEAHQKTCDLCKNSLKDIAPPYLVKERLYNFSRVTKGRIQGPPNSWKIRWITTSKWESKIFTGRGSLKKEFLDAYNSTSTERIILL